MATGELSGERSVSIGRVLGRGFGTLGSNPVATFGVAALLTAVPAQLWNIVAQMANVKMLPEIGYRSAIAIGFASLLVGLTLSAITQGALVRATIAHSEGGRAGFGESLGFGLRMPLPLVACAVVSALGIGLGLAFFVVPGVMLYVIWSVAAPALVDERLGPIEALGRSRALTSGARWKVFGLLLVLLVFYWLFSGVLGVVVTTALGGREAIAANLAEGRLSWPLLILGALSQTVTAAVWGVVVASLFVELRDWKDGPAGSKLVDVFR